MENNYVDMEKQYYNANNGNNKMYAYYYGCQIGWKN